MGLHISPGTAPPRERATSSSLEAGSSSSSGALMPRRLPQELPTFQRRSSPQNPPFLLGKVGGLFFQAPMTFRSSLCYYHLSPCPETIYLQVPPPTRTQEFLKVRDPVLVGPGIRDRVVSSRC